MVIKHSIGVAAGPAGPAMAGPHFLLRKLMRSRIVHANLLAI